MEVPSLAKIVAIANQKGGVGKTTTAIHLAHALAIAGKETLLVDLDPQANATSGLGHEPHGDQSRHFMAGKGSMRELTEKTRFERLSIVTGSLGATAAEAQPTTEHAGRRRLAEALSGLPDGVEIVVIDCPPSVSYLTRNALTAADAILIPIQAEYFAMEGLTRILDTVRRVKESDNPRLVVEGILLTMYDPALGLSGEVEREVREHFPEETYGSVIVRDVAIAEASSFGQTVFEYAPRSRGTHAYVSFAEEVLHG
jgi:chromosome partitioning protein